MDVELSVGTGKKFLTNNAIMIALFVRNFLPVPTESSTSMPLYCLAKRCLRPVSYTHLIAGAIFTGDSDRADLSLFKIRDNLVGLSNPIDPRIT